MRRSLVTVLVLAALITSAGCSTGTNVAPEEDTPAVTAPVEPSKPTAQTPAQPSGSAVAFSVVSSITTELGRQISCIYVDGFKDDASVWEKIRSHGVELAAQGRAKNSGLAVVVYFFDDRSSVMAPATIDGYWVIEEEAPHCVACVETWNNGTVIANKDPFYEKKAGSL